MKIRPVISQLFHADGQTDMTVLTVAFHNFANAPKNTPLARETAQLIFILDATLRWVVSLTLWPPYPQGKSLWY
jgi:hypothetical protein